MTFLLKFILSPNPKVPDEPSLAQGFPPFSLFCSDNKLFLPRASMIPNRNYSRFVYQKLEIVEISMNILTLGTFNRDVIRNWLSIFQKPGFFFSWIRGQNRAHSAETNHMPNLSKPSFSHLFLPLSDSFCLFSPIVCWHWFRVGGCFPTSFGLPTISFWLYDIDEFFSNGGT